MYKKLFVIYLAAAGVLFADEICIQDGTVLKGTIRSVTEKQIEIETGFAGILRVDRAQVSGFSTDEPVFMRLVDGAVLTGKVTALEQGTVEISGSDRSLCTPMESVRQSWVGADQDPEVLARAKAVAEMAHKWKYMLAANLSGQSGNSNQRHFGGNAEAVLASKQDELKLYGSYRSGESDGRKTTDERKIGLRYTSYFSDPWGWYLRQEFEQDQFENLRLRSVTAVGLSYRVLEQKKKKMGFDAGVSYRHERYINLSPDSSNIGLDFGLQHFFGGNRRFEMNNEFSCVPSVEDFTNYQVTQDSYLDVPISNLKRWKIRLGLRNDYNSQPVGDRKSLDSRYYSSLVAKWD
ncbi:MAG: DUF481 domain-containing protein [Verrucomicrobia bacterium]|nr:DUF481 domain-containing protein [Verrucomicrobiota bacterium]